MDPTQLDVEEHSSRHSFYPCMECHLCITFSLTPQTAVCVQLYRYDFERLYTNIPSGDMHAKIMQLVGKVFASHSQHAGIKVWGEAPAVWLTAAQMPARGSDRHGTGYAGKFLIYHLDAIAEFLRHLLDNMYVQFGDQL